MGSSAPFLSELNRLNALRRSIRAGTGPRDGSSMFGRLGVADAGKSRGVHKVPQMGVSKSAPGAVRHKRYQQPGGAGDQHHQGQFSGPSHSATPAHMPLRRCHGSPYRNIAGDLTILCRNFAGRRAIGKSRVRPALCAAATAAQSADG